ncbi:unnamed protein product [Candidula unifasciata]|uniref:MORN repeat-containing protein 1 n=1 Tax=Candidula unifasciata TaxID=100452 RepID=A0A8S4A738_9EUPU|nr:unnamed protein product [Candidula unifasciata]
MADDSNKIEQERREAYIGEKQNHLRDGYGTYIYKNSFFRYEGQWLKGIKHGHGKLVMKDGTYYEGQFVKGEINGNGYKYSAHAQTKYTGQFLYGEMHGDGSMIYKNGSVYDGQWYRNKRHGFGTLNTRRTDEVVVQFIFADSEEANSYDYTYHNLSNGDRYEGQWVMDKRQGHGELMCSDGTSYNGQFMNNFFHGEGMMRHASGIYYSGLWINGYPAVMATKIVLIGDQSPLVLSQGQPFSIKVECRNDEDELVPDSARELQVIAGFKYWEPKEGSALFDMIEDVENKPIPTPFYSVVPYPLTDQLPETKTTDDHKSETRMTSTRRTLEEDDEDDVRASIDEAFLDPPQITSLIKESKLSIETADDRSSFMSAVKQPSVALLTYLQEELPADQEGEADDVTQLFPPVATKPTTNGICEWLNLQLAPPPPMYRPFVIMEEETKTATRKSLLKERKSLPRNSIELSKYPSKIEKVRKEEKFARPGEYILIVQDVTNPPFMGRRLEPAYLVIQLTEPQETIIKKKRKGDKRSK